MPQSIPAGITRDHVLKALADLDMQFAHPFGRPTGYELLHEGRRYAPKAVVGVAFRHSSGRILGPEEFSGGEAPGQANYVLRRLGFQIIKKGEGEEPATPELEQTGKKWTDSEVRVIVADYFAMLREELHGRPYSKSEHRQAISSSLPARTNASIEFKHANISAVLLDLGLPYIDGYKPRGNYQSLLAEAVETYLEVNPGLLAELPSTPVISPQAKPTLIVPNLDVVIEAPPEQVTSARTREKPWLTRRGRRIDFAEVARFV